MSSCCGSCEAGGPCQGAACRADTVRVLGQRLLSLALKQRGLAIEELGHAIKAIHGTPSDAIGRIREQLDALAKEREALLAQLRELDPEHEEAEPLDGRSREAMAHEQDLEQESVDGMRRGPRRVTDDEGCPLCGVSHAVGACEWGSEREQRRKVKELRQFYVAARRVAGQPQQVETPARGQKSLAGGAALATAVLACSRGDPAACLDAKQLAEMMTERDRYADRERCDCGGVAGPRHHH